ncbi:MAG TPA: nuclear transport factor 2 family protein [Terriglobales bacterium]|nr:nuclear transport factor 2 family protein [Terriglobales bacterium]
MKGGIVLVVAVCALAAGLNLAQAQSKPEGPSAKVLALENKWNVAYQKGDISTLNALFADDFIITDETGSTFSKAGYIAHSGDPEIKVEVSDLSDVKIRMHGNVAVVTGAYHEKGTNKGKPYEYRDRFTDIWLNSGGNWQLIASQYSIPAKG